MIRSLSLTGIDGYGYDRIHFSGVVTFGYDTKKGIGTKAALRQEAVSFQKVLDPRVTCAGPTRGSEQKTCGSTWPDL